MRILFDRNVPNQLARFLAKHQVRTTADQGWNRLTNGDLLNAAEAEGFDVMVTADQNLRYQQNLKNRKLALIVLGTNKLSLLEAQSDRIVQAVATAKTGTYRFVEYTLSPRRKP